MTVLDLLRVKRQIKNERLNHPWFRTLDEAIYCIDLGRDHYNKV